MYSSIHVHGPICQKETCKRWNKCATWLEMAFPCPESYVTVHKTTYETYIGRIPVFRKSRLFPLRKKLAYSKFPLLNFTYLKPNSLKLSTIDTLAWMILCWWSQEVNMHYTMVSNIKALHPLDASNTPLIVTTPKCLQTWPNIENQNFRTKELKLVEFLLHAPECGGILHTKYLGYLT